MRISSYRDDRISGFFVFLTLSVFVAFSMFVMLLGAGAYHSARMRARETGDYRILTGCIRTLIRTGDGFAGISVRREADVPALVLDEPYGDMHYLTRVYVWDGWLRESFTDGEMPFDPGSGEKLCPALGFEADLENGLLDVRLMDAQGTWNEVSMVIYANRQTDSSAD